MHRSAVKRLWLRLHVFMGMGFGLLFVFAGLTGSLLVFHRAIDAWLNPALLMRAESKEARSLDEVLASLRAAVPDLPAPAYLDLPRTNTDVLHVWYRLRGDRDSVERKVEVWLDPGTGEVLGRRQYGTSFTSVVYGLHREWLAGNVGETMVGIVGAMLVVSIITGAYLWWPQRGPSGKAPTAARTGSALQRQYAWHKSVGISSATVLILIACSGIFIEFHEWLTPAIRLLSPVAEAEPAVSSRIPLNAAPIAVEQAMGIARQRFPDAEATYLMFPQGPAGAYGVGMRRPDDVLKTGGSSGVWIDQYNGDVLAVQDWRQFTAGETFVAWMFPLHNGEAFGLAGRLVVFLSGLVPLVLYVTALRMWWLKRRAKSRRRFSPRRQRSSTALS